MTVGPVPAAAPLVRGWLLLVAVGHALACAGWWWLAPGGFPLAHARTFSGLWLPLGLGLIALVGVIGVLRRREEWAIAAHAACTAVWVAGAAAAIIVFPSGRLRLVVAAAIPVGVLVVASVVVRLLAPTWRTSLATVLAIAGAAIGFAFPQLQTAPVPSTRPAGEALARPTNLRPAPPVVELRDGVWLHPRQARVEWTAPTATPGPAIDVFPWLSFESRSPDGGWTLFARQAVRGGDHLGTPMLGARRPGVPTLEAVGLCRRTLDIEPSEDARTLDLVATATLDAPEYAHLAEHLVVVVSGLAAPRIAFSASPNDVVDVLPSDYPVGRPARFAALYPDERLRVLQATSAEKGPFTVLAEGALGRADALTITLYDGADPILRLELPDFAAQASTERSPTAGWGAPQNAISFRIEEDPSGDPAAVVLRATWADTAIGRGFDTVGHAAGTYANRVRITRLR